MTKQFQYLLFNMFGDRFKKNQIETFSDIVNDLPFANAILKEYESCWVTTEGGYLRGSTYLAPISENGAIRMFGIMPMMALDETEAIKKEFGDDQSEVETYVIGATKQSIQEYNKKRGDESIAEENNNTKTIAG